MAPMQRVNLALRVLMELGIVIALSYWGFQTGTSLGAKVLLSVSAPLLGFGIWGLVDFHQAGSLSEPLRLVEELVVSGVAAAAWYAAGQPLLGWALALISVVYHALVYLSGGTLLKH